MIEVLAAQWTTPDGQRPADPSNANGREVYIITPVVIELDGPPLMNRYSANVDAGRIVVAAFGAVSSWLGLLAVPAAVLIGTSFSMPMAAFAATRESESTFPPLFRFVIVPMFLFSGTFFPVSQMPLAFELAAYATPIWHGVELCRGLTLGTTELLTALGHVAYLLVWTVGGFLLARRSYRRRLFK